MSHSSSRTGNHKTLHGAAQSPGDASDSMQVCLDAGSLGRRVVASLPTMFARGVSLHDRNGYCHWRSGSDNASSEYLGVRAALEAFAGKIAPSRVDVPLPSGVTAVLLISRTDDGMFTGFVMLLVPSERLRGKGRAAPDLPIPVVRAARHWGELAQMHAAGIAGNIAAPPARPAAEAIADAPAEPDCAADQAGNAESENKHRVTEEVRQFSIALHAQRLMPLNTELRIRRYEVLLRDNQSGGQSAPSSLLHSAETSGAASYLDRRVITTLVTWLREHLEAWGDEPSQFSVNLAASSLTDRSFVDCVRERLDAAQLPPGLVALEVDHRTMASNRRDIERMAAACEAAQIGLVIDNFTLQDNGVDLLALPALRLLKIDRALTADLGDSRYHQAVVSGIAQMARLAGVHTVAKQVETAEENALLANLGLDFVQSFAGAAPVALEVLEQGMMDRVVVDSSALIDPDLPDFLRIRPASG
jgi:EAL domain-containing protein (putative c-di-GMP-specific phosphodiesterase class I)